MVSDFKIFLLSGKPKKALCGIFCGKSISEFSKPKRFCLIARVKMVYRSFIF